MIVNGWCFDPIEHVTALAAGGSTHNIPRVQVFELNAGYIVPKGSQL
jgi:hypothetical protein